jgi:hypothetical protein
MQNNESALNSKTQPDALRKLARKKTGETARPKSKAAILQAQSRRTQSILEASAAKGPAEHGARDNAPLGATAGNDWSVQQAHEQEPQSRSVNETPYLHAEVLPCPSAYGGMPPAGWGAPQVRPARLPISRAPRPLPCPCAAPAPSRADAPARASPGPTRSLCTAARGLPPAPAPPPPSSRRAPALLRTPRPAPRLPAGPLPRRLRLPLCPRAPRPPAPCSAPLPVRAPLRTVAVPSRARAPAPQPRRAAPRRGSTPRRPVPAADRPASARQPDREQRTIPRRAAEDRCRSGGGLCGAA